MISYKAVQSDFDLYLSKGISNEKFCTKNSGHFSDMDICLTRTFVRNSLSQITHYDKLVIEKGNDKNLIAYKLLN